MKSITTEQRIKFDMHIPSDILTIFKIFKEHNHSLFICGGAVRDSYLNITPKDYDLVTNALPDKVEEMMLSASIKTIPTGKAFGVINVFIGDNEYEIATLRSDGEYLDSRRPDSVIFGSIEEDSRRRDFKINALFYDIETNEIIDLVGGIDDLKNNIIRTVGVPEDRFKEDKLRIMRFCRLVARFDSNIDPAIDTVLSNDASLDGISGERIRDEFIKGVKSAKSVVSFLKLIDKYNLFDWVFKGLIVDRDFIEISDPIILIARLLRKNDINSLGKKLNQLKYSVDEIKDMVFLIRLIDLSIGTAVDLKRRQKHVNLSDEQIITFTYIQGIEYRLVETFLEFNLSVNGEEIMEKTSLKQGPELGKMIHNLETNNFEKLTILKTNKHAHN